MHGGTRRNKTRGNFRKVFHRRAKHGDLTEGRRFEDIVTAGRNEGASDKGTVSQSIKRGQLTNTVKQENGYVVGDGGVIGRLNGVWLCRPWNWQSRPPDELAMRFVD